MPKAKHLKMKIDGVKAYVQAHGIVHRPTADEVAIDKQFKLRDHMERKNANRNKKQKWK